MTAATHPDATPCQRPGPCLHPVHQLEQERAAKEARDREWPENMPAGER